MTALAILSALSWVSDLACFAFAVWTAPSLWRVLVRRKLVRYWDPLRAVALLLLSGRYAFTIVRWAYGAHRELLAHGEVVERQAAFAWSLLTLVVAAVVIRAYERAH